MLQQCLTIERYAEGMRSIFIWPVLLSASLGIVACGGTNAMPTSNPAPIVTTAPPVMTPSMTPSMAPTGTPSTTPSATTLSEATLLGAPGFVAPTTNLTVYVLSGDSPTTLECTVASGCTAAWPPVAPPAGVALSAGFAVFTRSDNNAMQLEYMGHPLYTFAHDSAAGQTNGNGLVAFGGTWSVARP
jgi:predicted lipoprotein with Yx(FWY)xxD motif